MTEKEITPTVTEKNKKNEILEAYNELLKKVSSEDTESRQQAILKEKDEALVQKAASMSDEKIVKKLADVKILVGQSLDTLEQELTDEYKRLSDIRHAIQIESQHLEEVHEIKKNADSLAVLLLAQKEHKGRFEKEMAQAKSEWQSEKERVELEQAEYEQSLQRQREREDEEYNYDIKLKRKKDTDTYQMKKEALERELTEKKAAVLQELQEREIVVENQENELIQLKEQAKVFETMLDAAVKDARQEAEGRIASSYEQRMALESAANESELKLNKQTIETLQSKIQEQEVLINTLTQKSDSAGKQAQEIALKALDSASKMRFYGSVEDKKQHQL